VVIGGVIETIDSTINYSFFFIIKWSFWGETVKESDISIST